MPAFRATGFRLLRDHPTRRPISPHARKQGPMTERNVPFFNYPALFAERGDEYADTLREVMSRGAYIMQKDLIQFAEELADFLGAQHVTGVADGPVALTLPLKASGIGGGDGRSEGGRVGNGCVMTSRFCGSPDQ